MRTPLLLIAILHVLAGAIDARAATFTVNSTADGGDASAGDGVCETASGNGVCTLRAAIQEANAQNNPDTIQLPAGTYTLTISNGAFGEDGALRGDLDVNAPLTITGAGAPTTIVDGGGLDRVFDVFANTTLSNLTIRNGHSIADGGAVETFASLTLSNVAINGNTADGVGGGVSNVAPATWTNVSISGNTAAGTEGGGGISHDNGTLTLVNVTVSGNTATKGGAIENKDTVVLTNVTLASNGGDNLDNQGPFNGGTPAGSATLKNTIVANSTSGANCAGGALVSSGHNLDSGSSCGLSGSGDKSNMNPNLGSLQDNGGPTFTQALQSPSPAIDGGDNNGCPATDQRGAARPVDGDGNGSAVCDIGAFEFGGVPPTTTTTTTLFPSSTTTSSTVSTTTSTAPPTTTTSSSSTTTSTSLPATTTSTSSSTSTSHTTSSTSTSSSSSSSTSVPSSSSSSSSSSTSTSSSSSSTTSTTSTTLPPAVCGNGVLEPGEECDGMQLGGATCVVAIADCPTCTPECTVDCSCCVDGLCIIPTTTSTSTSTSTTTSSSTTSSTSTSTSTSSTSTTSTSTTSSSTTSTSSTSTSTSTSRTSTTSTSTSTSSSRTSTTSTSNSTSSSRTSTTSTSNSTSTSRSTSSSTSTSTSTSTHTTSTTSSTSSSSSMTTSSTASSSTTSSTRPTTTTLRPAEVCDNCLDDDGDGETDFEDPGCCPLPATMHIIRARFLAGKAGAQHGRLRLRALLAKVGFGDLDPRSEEVTIQLRSPDGELVCATMPPAQWVEARPRNFTFADPSGQAASGLTRGQLRVRRTGAVEFRAAGTDVDVSRYARGELRVTVSVGARCSAGVATLRPKGRKGFVFP